MKRYFTRPRYDPKSFRFAFAVNGVTTLGVPVVKMGSLSDIVLRSYLQFDIDLNKPAGILGQCVGGASRALTMRSITSSVGQIGACVLPVLLHPLSPTHCHLMWTKNPPKRKQLYVFGHRSCGLLIATRRRRYLRSVAVTP